MNVMPRNQDPMLSLVTPSLKSSRHRKRTAQEKLYSYNPLRSPRHIRLLKLLPGEGGTWLRCSLVEVHLETNLPYQAISYAWGDANDQRSVLCKGKFINITRNLLDALTVFRHPEAARYLWADAICINQRNEEERSAQVQLMGQIYSKASQVLFWVGMEGSDVAESLFDFLVRYITPRYEQLIRERHAQGLSKYAPGAWVDIVEDLRAQTSSVDLLVPDAHVTAALPRLLAASVFRRGWIIQEFSLACSLRICWGMASADAKWLSIAIIILVNTYRIQHTKGSASGSLALYNLIDERSQIPEGIPASFLYHLVNAEDAAFSDERDRVYGLLGLPSIECELGEPFIQPDYSVEESEVSLRVVERFLVREGDLEVLTCIDHSGDYDEMQPSWVPNWQESDWYLNPLEIENRGEIKSISRHELGLKRCISIQGIRIDTVAAIKGDYGSDLTVRARQAVLRNIYEQGQWENLAYAATLGESIARRYMIDGDKRADKDDIQTRACREFMEHDPTEVLQSSPLPLCQAVPSKKVLASWFLVTCSYDRKRFLKTDKDMIGVGPTITQEGDVLVVLFGKTCFPFLLRPVGNLWRFVGSCYIHALRDSKVIDRWKESGEPAEDFMIY